MEQELQNMNRNSTIKQKYGICIDEPDSTAEKPLIAGRCEYHYWVHRNKINEGKQKQQTTKLITKNLKTEYSKELRDWFEQKMFESIPICENCGKEAWWIKKPAYKKLWYASQAHIIPKRKDYGCPSVATHPMNHMVLFPAMSGICNCHDLFDNSWSTASTMKVWPVAQRRFFLFHNLIIPSEKKNIPEIFYKCL